jgi:hypothetical protein
VRLWLSPQFNALDGSGIASSAAAIRISRCWRPRSTPMARVGGVPVVLLDAPLGTYLEHRGRRLSQGADLLLRRRDDSVRPHRRRA